MRLVTVLLFALLAMSVSIPAQLMAHVPPNSVKIPLDKDNPIEADYSCFIHWYVHFKLYEGKFEKTDRRFYLREFTGNEQEGNELTISFLVMDKKTKENFNDSMKITRDADGYWFYTDEQGERHQVTTYVHEIYYYYNKYIFVIMAGFTLIAGTGIFLMIRRRRKGKDVINK